LRRKNTILEQSGVGQEDYTGQFGLGKAPRDTKPVTKIEISKEKEKEIAAMQEWEDYDEQNDEEIQKAEEQAMIAKMQRASKQKGDKRQKIDKNVAFAEYKQTEEAKALEETIIQCRRDLTNSREELKRKTESINLIKAEIDQARIFLEAKAAKKHESAIHAAKDPGFSSGGFDDSPDHRAEMIDEEELAMIK